MAESEKPPLVCSMCGKTSQDVALLFAGLTGCICDACVVTCLGVMVERAHEALATIQLCARPKGSQT